MNRTDPGDSVLPPAIREKLWPFLEEGEPSKEPGRPQEEILADLMATNPSIRMNVAELLKAQEEARRASPAQPPSGS